ncbi:Glutamate--cysteine ligase [compost metagenome]
MPLTLFHATMLTGYSKMLVRFLLEERQKIVRPHYAIEKYNIFNARRDGLHAKYIYSLAPKCQRIALAEHIHKMNDILAARTDMKEDLFVLQYIKNYVYKGVNDSDSIRNMIKHSVAINTVSKKMRKVLFAIPREARSLFTSQ